MAMWNLPPIFRKLVCRSFPIYLLFFIYSILATADFVCIMSIRWLFLRLICSKFYKASTLVRICMQTLCSRPRFQLLIGNFYSIFYWNIHICCTPTRVYMDTNPVSLQCIQCVWKVKKTCKTTFKLLVKFLYSSMCLCGCVHYNGNRNRKRTDTHVSFHFIQAKMFMNHGVLNSFLDDWIRKPHKQTHTKYPIGGHQGKSVRLTSMSVSIKCH